MSCSPGDQGHVVIDKQNCEAVGGDSVEQVVERFLLTQVEACRRFVEQQHRGIGGERASNLDQALMAIAEAGDRLVGAMLQSDEIERGASASPKRIMSALDKRIAVPLGADDDIFERSHRPEQTNVLEGAREA